ncbi:hypothetical protein SDC9_50493 [bioreactor metagenome]|uniref:Uncharacterized protein n=1 Tax=bioreactor metagenome TaxID=1076179 RepID=A0A644WKC2_9ZZZZ
MSPLKNYTFIHCHSEAIRKNLMFSTKMRSFTVVQDDRKDFFSDVHKIRPYNLVNDLNCLRTVFLLLYKTRHIGNNYKEVIL